MNNGPEFCCPLLPHVLPARGPRRRGHGAAWTAPLLLLLAPLSMAAPSELSAQGAMKIIEGCMTHAKAKGHSHAIAVLDAGGHPVATLRMDGNPPGVAEFALQKASAVAHWQFSTAAMQAAAKQTPGFAAAPFVVTVAGGIPVYSADGTQFIGAVGVSGEAPGDDEACAQAGVLAAGFSIKRAPHTP